MKTIKLRKSHTHNGIERLPGEVIRCAPEMAQAMIDQGMAIPAPELTRKLKDDQAAANAAKIAAAEKAAGKDKGKR